MQYFGGKVRLAKEIVSILEANRKEGQLYAELFVGGASVISKMSGEREAYDYHIGLIEMYKGLQNGWTPPDAIDEDLYNKLRVLKESTPLKAFAGFGCSFSGKYFGGYARNKRGDDYCGAAKRSLLRDISKMQDVKFGWADYKDLYFKDTLIYCDPPYSNTTGYSTGNFDSDVFWQWCRNMSKNGNTIIISEYSAPKDFTCIWSKETKTEIRTKENGREKRIEKLFTI